MNDFRTYKYYINGYKTHISYLGFFLFAILVNQQLVEEAKCVLYKQVKKGTPIWQCYPLWHHMKK